MYHFKVNGSIYYWCEKEHTHFEKGEKYIIRYLPNTKQVLSIEN